MPTALARETARLGGVDEVRLIQAWRREEMGLDLSIHGEDAYPDIVGGTLLRDELLEGAGAQSPVLAVRR